MARGSDAHKGRGPDGERTGERRTDRGGLEWGTHTMWREVWKDFSAPALKVYGKPRLYLENAGVCVEADRGTGSV